MRRSLSLIVAMTKDRVIGKNNELPWYISEDLKLFKQLTTGNTVLMGKNTFDSIFARLGKPLPNRNNLVLSNSLPENNQVEVCRTLEDALKKAESYGREIFVIGGAKLYEQTLPLAHSLYISHVKAAYDGDTYFPPFNEEDWVAGERKSYTDFEWVHYLRKKS